MPQLTEEQVKNKFRKAERRKGYAKIAFVGSSGSGKSWTSLLLMRGLLGDSSPFAVADTENGSCETYSHLTSFDIAIIEPPYTVNKFAEVVDDATAAGYKGLIVDGISPFWMGKGGLLDQKSNLEKRGKNSFTAWGEITPLYNEMVSTILNAKIHMICTMRAKTDYSMSTNDGVTRVVKQGLAPMMRDELDFEFLTVFMLDQNHKASVSKDRTGLFAHRGIFDVGKETGKEIANWLDSGAEIPDDYRPIVTAEHLQKVGEAMEKEKKKNIF